MCFNLLLKKELDELLLRVIQSQEISSFLKLLEGVPEDKRREIIKEWVISGRIKN